MLNLIIGVILARILSPEDYGKFGLIAVFPAFALVFVNSGFGSAYIQKRNPTNLDASSIFYFNITLSVFFYVLLFLFAPVVANFYQIDELKNLIRIVSLGLVINSFGMVQTAVLTKNINFKKQIVISLVSVLISGSVGIYSALNGFGVWSLVIQHLSLAVLLNTSLWLFQSFRPILRFSYKSMRELFSYGSFVLGSSLLLALFKNMNTLVIGKYFDINELGFFNKATGFNINIMQQPVQAVAAVSFPVLSSLNTDVEATKRSLKKFLFNLNFLILFAGSIFLVISHPLILLVLTRKWEPMIIYFQLMLLGGFLGPINSLNQQVFLALGYSKLVFKISILKISLKILALVVSINFGIIYIIIGGLVVNIIGIFINGYFSKHFIKYSLWDQFKDNKYLYLGAILVVPIGFQIVEIIQNLHLKILFGSLISAVIFISVQYMFNRRALFETFSLIKERIK